LTYYTKNDNNNAKVSFKKCAKLLNSDNDSAKVHLFYLEYLLNNNSSKELNNILTKIDQIPISNLLRFIKCKIYIELKEYSKAKFHLCYIVSAFIGYFIQDHLDFWSYLYEVCEINKNDFTEFGIVDKFSKYMYKEHGVYFVSNLTNLNSELCQFQENYMLKHEGVSKLEGLGWIEYRTSIRGLYYDTQLSIEIEINSIEMQIEYIRFGYNPCEITYIPDTSFIGYLLPDYHEFFSNVPETFKD
ncbi:hypothetical protein RhiirB3_442175, partial [Rhizophagus irregularis]